MEDYIRTYWVRRLAQCDPRDNKYDDPRSVVYREMIRCNVPLEDRVAIDKAAMKLFEERKPRPADLRPEKVNWANEYLCDWEPVNPFPDSSRGDLPRLGTLERATLDRLWREIVDLQFNTEGEKQMEKIDWHKPLRGRIVYEDGRAEPSPSTPVATYKSGKQRVVWIGERVYPVDEQGRATANVDYGTHWASKGDQIVENVPEENFFLGLARNKDGTYWLTDGGTVSNMGTMNYWKKLMGDQPHWIVDTRKPAKPPAVDVHDPKDWTVVSGWGNSTTSYGMRTEAEARAIAKEHAVKRGDVKVVRVRTTPPPADTARYIQLWRVNENAPWLINRMGDGRQEFTWDDTERRCTGPLWCAIKVRD